jgi:hypothetical protein
MHYAVMIRCIRGTSSLHGTSAGAYWTRDTHVIAWTYEDTFEDARRTCDALTLSRNSITEKWIEERA